jgi:hypothetical protein
MCLFLASVRPVVSRVSARGIPNLLQVVWLAVNLTRSDFISPKNP